MDGARSEFWGFATGEVVGYYCRCGGWVVVLMERFTS